MRVTAYNYFMNSPRPFSRRAFLKATAASSIAFPFFTPRLISAPPSDRVLHASMGAGGMARADLTELITHPNFQLTAIAEVEPAKAGYWKQKFPDLRVYQDWRELLDKEKELTSVNVSIPDHMHAPVGMSAMQRGLHVYGQKPLTHDIYETRRLTEFAREKKLVTQMGIQIHSSNVYRQAVQLVQTGAVGKVKEVHTFSNKKWGDSKPKPAGSDPIPAGFDWNLWLGVCAERPFIGNGYYHPANWRKRIDFGTGTFGDMGCHIYDPVFEALALTAPISVRSEGAAPNADCWATDAIIHYVFPGTKFTEGKTVRVTWYDGDQRPPKEIQDLVRKDNPNPDAPPWKLTDQGSIVIGTKGVLLIPHVDRPRLFPTEQYADYKMPETKTVNHWHQFVDAILGKDKTLANFDYAGPLTESVLLGSVATRFPNTTLEWNAKKLTFNVKEANQFVQRKYRKGWDVKGL